MSWDARAMTHPHIDGEYVVISGAIHYAAGLPAYGNEWISIMLAAHEDDIGIYDGRISMDKDLWDEMERIPLANIEGLFPDTIKHGRYIHGFWLQYLASGSQQPRRVFLGYKGNKRGRRQQKWVSEVMVEISKHIERLKQDRKLAK